jgi:uncharacterized repeat protein (TIGR01451 family)
MPHLRARLAVLTAVVTASSSLLAVSVASPDDAVGAARAASAVDRAVPTSKGSVPAVKAGLSRPVRDLPNAPAAGRTKKDGATLEKGGSLAVAGTGKADAVAQTDAGFGPADQLTAPLPNQNFAGQTSPFSPPDTVGDVGPNHYVQLVNAQFQVWNKTGTSLAGPTQLQTLWSSNTVNDGGCDTQNAGDPIVLYDQTVDRWMLAQFTNPNTAPFDMCIAYSQTPNPTGAFFTYSFRLSASHDYEKFGIWPDGLYMSTFEGSGQLGAYVFDRAAMISGSPATFQYFGSGAGALGASPAADTGRARMFPSDWDGLNPPAAGEPNHFLVSRDSGNGQGGAADGIDMYDFHVDWTNPANSTFTLATTMNTAPFDINLNCANTLGNTVARECIPSGPAIAGSTVMVDSLPGRLMHRVQYRNFGDHESMVVVQASVDADGNDRSGERWYELRNTGGGWSIYQQGTYAPGTAHRWMGSIAMDHAGNIALGYSISDPTNPTAALQFASVAYTGRLANAPLGSMPEPERRIVNGTQAQVNQARWGDYSSMNVDPVDDCTFWYTQQFGGNAQTQVAAFRFTSCSATDLRITKTDSPDPVYAGDPLTYTLNVVNDGPNTAEDVTVTDVLPAGVTYLSSAPACANAAGTLTCDVGDLLPGQSVPIVVQVTVPADFLGAAATATITNTATVAAANQTDPNPGNNTATATTTVKALADLAVTKICKPDVAANAGTNGFCDIHVDNLGPSDATSVTLTDVLTSASPFSLVSVTATPSGSCAPTGSGPVTSLTITCDLGTEPAGGRSTVRVTVTASDVAQVNDVATVNAATADPVSGNNQASGRVDFIGSADLSLTKDGPATVVAGTQMTYTIKVRNDGPSVARNVAVSDQLPAGVSFVTVTPEQGTCTFGQPTARDLRCGLGDLPVTAVGDTVDIVIKVAVAPDVVPGTILVNEAVVSSATADPDNNDVRASVSTTASGSADLSVTKTASPNPVTAGNPLSYTISVRNAGPSTATGVQVTDTIPAGTTFVSGQDGNGNTVCTLVQTGDVICSLASMAPGTTKTVFLTVKVSPAAPGSPPNGSGPPLHNVVVVSSDTPDPATGNNTFTLDTGVKTSAELWLDKQGTQRSGNPSPIVTYTLVVHNDAGCEKDAQSTQTPTCGAGGPSDAQNIVVMDNLPLDPKKLTVQFVSPQCVYSKTTVPHSVRCTAATVPAGATVTFVIEAQVQGSVGNILNSATVSSSTPDPVTTNNRNDVTLVMKGGTGKK